MGILVLAQKNGGPSRRPQKSCSGGSDASKKLDPRPESSSGSPFGFGPQVIVSRAPGHPVASGDGVDGGGELCERWVELVGSGENFSGRE